MKVKMKNKLLIGDMHWWLIVFNNKGSGEYMTQVKAENYDCSTDTVHSTNFVFTIV